MPILGEIRIFAGNFAPQGWFLCQGQLLPISQYEALYNLIGTTYGGDGQTTFGLPNLQGRGPVHIGQGLGLSNYVLGQASGSETVTLTSNQMPAHTHLFQAGVNTDGTKTTLFDGTNAYPGVTSGATYASTTDSTMGTMTGPGGITGGNQPHENMQPFLAVNFIIAYEGIYPSQN